jgi:8-hydroxy-5-deazaflavin:NADPH oxidoreductase
MRIGIVGTGSMASGFARLLREKHEVWMGSRDTERGKQSADEVGATGGGSYADVVAEAEVVILAVPWTAVEETVPQLGDLPGKVVIDITNPYVDGQLQPPEGSSTGEEIQKMLPDAKVVKGWNHVFSAALTTPEVDGLAASVMIAGDHQDAKEVVFGLARDMGFDPFDVGQMKANRALDQFLAAETGLGFYPNTHVKLFRAG